MATSPTPVSPARLDPADLADALARWEAGTLVRSIATPTEVAEVRDELEHAARSAAADAAEGGADLAANPIRLSKRRLTDLLACERHLVVKAGGDREAELGGGGAAEMGPAAEALHLGVLVDALAEHHVVAGLGGGRLAPEPLELGVELCRAAGDRHEATVAWVGALDPDARRSFAERLIEKQVKLLERWPAFDGRWWPRTQERMAVALADGDVVLSGRADVTAGGPPTPWPVVLVEVKSGAFTIEQRDDGLVYGLLLALRDGVAPAAAITVTADGGVHVEGATADRLATAAERVGAAVRAAGELAGGRTPIERAGWRCDRCPVAGTCATAAGRRAAQDDSRDDSHHARADR